MLVTVPETTVVVVVGATVVVVLPVVVVVGATVVVVVLPVVVVVAPVVVVVLPPVVVVLQVGSPNTPTRVPLTQVIGWFCPVDKATVGRVTVAAMAAPAAKSTRTVVPIAVRRKVLVALLCFKMFSCCGRTEGTTHERQLPCSCCLGTMGSVTEGGECCHSGER